MRTSLNAPLDPLQPCNKRKRDSSPTPIMNKADALLALATRLSLIDAADGSNVVFSPLSLRALLSLVAAGASPSTAQQLLSFLNSDSIEDLNAFSSQLISKTLADASTTGGPNISFANSIWIQKGNSLKHSFEQVASNVYKAEMRESDFNTKVESKANAWVEDKTNGLIRNIIPRGSVTESDRLILMNALYFKGKWCRDYFKVKDTKKYKFHLLDGSSVKVPCMTNKKYKFRLRHTIGIFKDLKVLHLDYEKGDSKTQFTMCILLPDSVDGLAALAKRVGSEPGFLDCHLKGSSRELVKLRIPKFKVSFGFQASQTLKQLGISSLFEQGSLSEMVDAAKEGEKLYVKEIYHKAFIEVNEHGTEAAAATTAVKVGCMCPRYVNFVVDHPFMFVIREKKSGAVLFLGHVLNPLKED